MGDRCTGGCCRRFWLGFTPDGLAKVLSDHRAGIVNYRDIETIADMAIPLADQTIRMDGKPHDPSHGGAYYTCRHLAANGDCSIYERRPEMCSAYPYGMRCQIPGCEWDAGNGRLPVVHGYEGR